MTLDIGNDREMSVQAIEKKSFRIIALIVSLGIHLLVLFFASLEVSSGERFKNVSPIIPRIAYVQVDSHRSLSENERNSGSKKFGPNQSFSKPNLINGITYVNQKKSPEIDDLLPLTFLPSSELELSPVPISEPDFSTFNFSTFDDSERLFLHIRLRIYVDSKGYVKDVRLLNGGGENSKLLEQLQVIFYATKYIPGRRFGIDMPSYIELEINLYDGFSVAP